MNPRNARTAAALALEATAIVLLLLVVLGKPWPSERKPVSVYVLADDSTSVASGSRDEALAAVVASALGSRTQTDVRVVDFAGEADAPRRISRGASLSESERVAPDTRSSSNIEAALDKALRDISPGSTAAIAVVSDGNETEGDAERALQSAADARVPVLWRTIVPAVEAPRIVEVLAPPRARPGQDVPVIVRLAGETTRPVSLEVATGGTVAETARISLPAGKLGPVSVRLRARDPGTMLLDVALGDADGGAPLDRWNEAAAVDVEPPAQILYVADGPRPLARSLAAGGWSIEAAAPPGLDGKARSFGHYAAIVLDDVSAVAARPETWAALASSVRERGTGLLVLGGEQSFAAGSYRDSPLEAVVPVVSRAGALGDAAAVAFVVDKSGSMGASAAGVDRFRLAQRAVIETAATLTERDWAALIAFDVEARDLLPLQPAGSFRQAVSQPWAAQPRGGTRLAPALEAALKQIEGASAPRRLLVLVTDGFVDEAPDRALQDRLARGRIELVALAVGPDADVGMLTRLFPSERSTILRVGEAAELPTMMRKGLEMRRAPIERGRLAVNERQPLPFLKGVGGAWPRIAAYDVTMPAPTAIVHVESERGDPIVAYMQVGLGRVVAVTSGLANWTPEWLRWSSWPRLAGGLVEWVSSPHAEGGPTVQVTDLPRSVRVDVDSAQDGKWAASIDGRVRIQYPSGRAVQRVLIQTAPGRATAEIPGDGPGLYTITVDAGGLASRVVHLREPRRELAATGPNPAIDEWRRAGLVRDWSPAALNEVLGALPSTERSPSRALLVAMALFVLGVLVDRVRGK
jgi:Ca-activated chloride channel family protein